VRLLLIQDDELSSSQAWLRFVNPSLFHPDLLAVHGHVGDGHSVL